MLSALSTPLGDVTSTLYSNSSVVWHEVRAGSVIQVIRYELTPTGPASMSSLTGLGIWGTLDPGHFAAVRAQLDDEFQLQLVGKSSEDGTPVFVVHADRKVEAGNGNSMATIVHLGDPDLFVRSVSVYGHTGELANELIINDPQFNLTIPASTFAYEPPEGAEVINGNELLDGGVKGPRHQLEETAAPNFTLTDLNGVPVTLGALRGKYVMLDFWATWCGPCRETMPHIQEIHEQIEDLVVIGINLETRSKAARYMKNENYSFTVLVDEDGGVSALYDVIGIPTTVIINEKGQIERYLIGKRTGNDIRSALAQSGVSSL